MGTRESEARPSWGEMKRKENGKEKHNWVLIDQDSNKELIEMRVVKALTYLLLPFRFLHHSLCPLETPYGAEPSFGVD